MHPTHSIVSVIMPSSWFIYLFISIVRDVVADTSAFDHKVQYEHDNGERLFLRSKGRFARIIDIDEIKTIRRLLCRPGIIMMALDDDAPRPDWDIGQVLLGGTKWGCNSKQGDKIRTGIYAKIKQLLFPKENRVDVVTDDVGPLDILEEANIHLQYIVRYPHEEIGARRMKRYSPSNMLTDLLNNIDWHANISLKVAYNMDNQTEMEASNISIHRYTSLQNLVQWDMTSDVNGTQANFTNNLDKTFTWDCIACYGITTFNYVFELVIYKIDNKPVLKRYISQIDSYVELNADFRFHFFRESTSSGSRVLWHSPMRNLLNVTLAKAPNLPPVHLVVSSNNLVFGQIHAAASEPTKIQTAYRAAGKYVLSQTLTQGKPVHGDTTIYNWTVSPGGLIIASTGYVNLTAAIFQTIVFNASVQWSGKDVSAILSPPAIITIKPTMTIKGNSTTYSRCYDSHLSLGADFLLSKATFLVQAFGLKIWDVLIASKFHQKYAVLDTILGERCVARCRAPVTIGPPDSMEETCGMAEERIPLYDNRMTYIQSDEVLFVNNGSQIPHTNVSYCLKTEKCHIRFMSPVLAMSLATLYEFAKSEFPRRKLVILSGYDSNAPTKSLYAEGRALDLTLTAKNDISSLCDCEPSLLEKISRLAVCSNFKFVNISYENSAITVGVPKETEETIVEDHYEIFQTIMEKTGSPLQLSSCQAPESLSVGENYPKSSNPDNVCGSSFTHTDRFYGTFQERLYPYPYEDVRFEDEDAAAEWCGNPLRPCHKCNALSQNETWRVCSNRLMTPRLALRLRRLATLLKYESGVVRVRLGYEEQTANSGGVSRNRWSSLYREGRGIMIEKDTESKVNLHRILSLAICAGFDFVKYTNSSTAELFVKPQEHYYAQLISYPNGKIMTGVSLKNTEYENEYLVPRIYANESRIPALIDGQNSNTPLGEQYTVSDFQCPGYRFLRVDPSLVQCLELASEEFGAKILIVKGSGYRGRSVNFENIDTRNTQERFRFMMGQAVELQPNRGSKSPGLDIIRIGISIMRMCLPITRPQQRAIGMGCHKDKLYVDFRPLISGLEHKFLVLWNVDGSPTYYNLLPRVYTTLTGGPVIVPYDKAKACETPIGEEFKHLVLQLKQPPQCSNVNDKEFCSKTRPYRQDQAELLQERLSSAAGSNNLPRPEITEEVKACVVDSCGGCPSSGSVWDTKVRNCAKLVQKFITKASRPFQSLHNRATFFNAENSESTVHSLACHFGYVCVESIQIYSLLIPLVTAKYRPDPKRSVEERLFTVEDNPTPLMEIVAQEMAIRASGTVRFFLDSERDLSFLRNVLKVIMALNTNVKEVEFHITENLRKDSVKASIQRKIELWAGSTCNKWSRFSIAPYTVHVIPTHRHKRSVVHSVARNHAKLVAKNWEYQWLYKL